MSVHSPATSARERMRPYKCFHTKKCCFLKFFHDFHSIVDFIVRLIHCSPSHSSSITLHSALVEKSVHLRVTSISTNGEIHPRVIFTSMWRVVRPTRTNAYLSIVDPNSLAFSAENAPDGEKKKMLYLKFIYLLKVEHRIRSI